MTDRYDVDTFLFTEVHRSAEMWEQHPKAFTQSLARYDSIVQTSVLGQSGRIVRPRGEGEGFFGVFPDASSAISAALSIQRRTGLEEWDHNAPIQVAIGINSGYAEKRAGDYYGTAVNRAARLRTLANPGQVLIDAATESLAREQLPEGCSLRDLGFHRLRDLTRPVQIFQLLHPDLQPDFPSLRSLDALPNNLPIQLTSFIGRQQEIDEIRRILSGNRLLTLTGTGGTGKTRLALQVAAEILDDFPDGVWLIDLAAISDAEGIIPALASVLHITQDSEVAEQALKEDLRDKRVLLIPDNCEHLVEECAVLCETLLVSCPQLKVLATSREALGVPGEITYRVPTFDVPSHESLPPAEELTRYPVIDLFVSRARAAEPNFVLNEANAPWVAQLCRRLDGIPLAIELAAARVRVLSPQQIASRLDDRFQLLTGGARTALDRQRTLRALVDWSFNLLSDREQVLLRRISIFMGGFTLETAEEVAAGKDLDRREILNLLGQLVDKSLVLAEFETGINRYRQLETIRQYGSEKLRDADEQDQLFARHRDWFLDLAEQAEAGITGPNPGSWLDLVDAERDNFRAIFSRYREETETTLRLSGALWEYFELRGYLREGRRYLEEALVNSDSSPSPSRARALRGAGNLAMDQGDFETAKRWIQECLEVETALGNQSGMAKALNNLGVASHEQGNLSSAQENYEKSLAIMRELGEERGIAILLNNLGSIAHRHGDHQRAIELHEESLEIRRRLGNPRYIAHSLNNLGNVANKVGNFDKAMAFYEESLEIRENLGDRGGISLLLLNIAGILIDRNELERAGESLVKSLAIRKEIGDRKGVADTLEAMAILLKKKGVFESAASIFGCTESLREATGAVREASPNDSYNKQIEELIGALGEDALAKAWEAGKEMTLDEVISMAMDLA